MNITEKHDRKYDRNNQSKNKQAITSGIIAEIIKVNMLCKIKVEINNGSKRNNKKKFKKKL